MDKLNKKKTMRYTKPGITLISSLALLSHQVTARQYLWQCQCATHNNSANPGSQCNYLQIVQLTNFQQNNIHQSVAQTGLNLLDKTQPPHPHNLPYSIRVPDTMQCYPTFPNAYSLPVGLGCVLTCRKVGLRSEVKPKASPTKNYQHLYNRMSVIAAQPAEQNVSYQSNPKALVFITLNLIKSELSKCSGLLPIDSNTGKLIPDLLTPEHVEVLKKHHSLMVESLKQYQQTLKQDKQLVE